MVQDKDYIILINYVAWIKINQLQFEKRPKFYFKKVLKELLKIVNHIRIKRSSKEKDYIAKILDWIFLVYFNILS
jgi:hypothetical protein